MTYVSPMVRARAIVAGEVRALKSQVSNSARMLRLSPTVIVDLEREEAPVHVFRWVAWAATLTEQRRRTDLVIHLRRSIERPRNGWLEDRHFTAALAEWDRARGDARKRGGIMPAVNEIALDAYRTAIEGARKQQRTRDPEGETEATESAAAAGDEPSAEEIEDETEEEPVSARQRLKGRDRVLQVLSDTVRAAIAAQDMEAADAANNAISWLCGGREAG